MDKEKDTIEKDIITKGHNISSKRSDYPVSTDIPALNTVSVDNGKNKEALLLAEKLVTATYMVTSLIPDTDPIKIKIREQGVEFLSSMHPARMSLPSERAGIYRKIVNSIGSIVSLLTVTASIDLISKMNYSVLKREYDSLNKLLNSIEGIREHLSGEINIGSDFFGQKEDNFSSAETLPRLKDKVDYVASISHDKGQNNIKDKQDELSFTNRGQILTKKFNTRYQKDDVSKRPKSMRREEILEIIKNKGDVMIKDLSGEIHGCSEKTIQRELLALVSKGIIKKEGEKRWSRYLIA